MISDLSTNFNENRVPKWLVFVFVLLLLLTIVFVAFILLFKKETTKKTVDVLNNKIVSAQDLKIAKTNLDWMDKNRDERGLYQIGKMCDYTKMTECQETLPSNRSGIPVMWARFNYYLASGDKKELAILKQDIDNYADLNKAKLIQNNSWNCKLMIDLSKSSFFSVEEKEKIEKICFDSEYEMDQYLAKFSFQKNSIDFEKVKTSVDKDLAIVLNGETKSQISAEYESTMKGTGKYLKQNFSYASDFVARYLWKNNKDDLSTAYLLFDVSLQNYIYGKDFDMGDNCALGLGSLDLYVATKDERFKKLAKLLSLQIPKEMNSNNLENVAKCGLFLSDFYKTTKDESSLALKESIIKRVIDNNLDIKGFGGNKNDQGAFYAVYMTVFEKNIRDNGILTGLLLN